MEHVIPKRRTISGIVQGIESYERESISSGELKVVYVYFIELKDGDFIEIQSSGNVIAKEGQTVFCTYEEIEKDKTTYSYVNEDDILVEGVHKVTGNFATRLMVKKSHKTVEEPKEKALKEEPIVTDSGATPQQGEE